ncbi:MAG: hypothetical protein KF681_01845 [Bdellovibrionaceae bacterium]|nr:hypothetical protein [Pseudobdellovibrionaceae bacterium]
MGMLSRGSQWKLGSLVVLTACFVLFQNMSPLSEEFDIRDIAPTKPEGFNQYVYFPSEFHGGSASALGQEILDHNFGERLQALQFEVEMQGAKWGLGPHASGRGPASVGSASRTSGSSAPAPAVLRFGHRGGDRFGFSWESAVNVRCDYAANSNRVELSLNRALTSRAEVSFKHTTDDQQSTLNLNYQW